MKYRKLRGALALFLVLSLFVGLCGLTAFAIANDYADAPADTFDPTNPSASGYDGGSDGTSVASAADPGSGGSGEDTSGEKKDGPGMLDSMAKIRAIIILDHNFDGRGGEVPGYGETFKFQGPMGLTTVLPPAPVKENDTFLCWKGTVDGESKEFNAGQRVHLWEAVNFTAVWASDSDVNPNEADMKTDIRS